MPSQNVTVDARQVLRTLARLPSKARAVLRRAMRDTAKDIAAQVKALAPRKRDELRRKVKVRAAKRSRTSIGINVNASAEHTSFQELGTKYIQPLGFMRRAFDTKAPGAKSKIEHETVNALEREARK